MRKLDFASAVAQIIHEDPRYSPEAYAFVREALNFTTRPLKKSPSEKLRHVTAAKLLHGIRQYALREYGAMALTVLNSWGVRKCQDFGQIVFNLVNKEFIRKTEEDSIRDFDNGYDFECAFRKPFTPKKPAKEESRGNNSPSSNTKGEVI